MSVSPFCGICSHSWEKEPHPSIGRLAELLDSLGRNQPPAGILVTREMVAAVSAYLKDIGAPEEAKEPVGYALHLVGILKANGVELDAKPLDGMGVVIRHSNCPHYKERQRGKFLLPVCAGAVFVAAGIYSRFPELRVVARNSVLRPPDGIETEIVMQSSLNATVIPDCALPAETIR